jgi:hypothetical protein
MPPIEWSMVQSILLWLILPTIIVAATVLFLTVKFSQSERGRSLGGSAALLAGLTAGLALRNYQDGELVPFIPIQQVERTVETHDGNEATVRQWEFETGWRSLYCATLTAVLAAILVDSFCCHRWLTWFANLATMGVCVIVGLVLTPIDLLSTRLWVVGILAMVIWLNQISLRKAGQSKFGSCAPILLAFIWFGTTVTVAVLSHSVRFADLAMLMGSALAGVGFVAAVKNVRVNSLYSGPACFVPG